MNHLPSLVHCAYHSSLPKASVFAACPDKISAPHISAGVGLRGVKNVAAIGAGRWPAIHYCAKREVSDVVSIGSHHAHGLSGRVERGVKELSIRSPRETGVPVYAVHARSNPLRLSPMPFGEAQRLEATLS